MPIGMLVFGAVLALGHHTFNAWEDGKPVYNSSTMYNSLIQLLPVLLRLTVCFLVQT
jgi:hypothetical protein